jgi:hypothetical protein
MIVGGKVETDAPRAFVNIERAETQDIASLPERINADPENVEKGLAKLVLTLIELIRQLLEKQAMRRMEAGSLSDDQIENLGVTLMKLEDKVKEMQGLFGLENEDLNINLGPLGNLL